MLIPHIPEEPNLPLRHEHRHAKRMNRRISEPLVVKSTPAIQPLEILLVRLSPEEVEGSDLEIGKELAIIIIARIVVVEQPVEVRVRVDKLGMGVYEGAGARPEGREGARVVEDVHVEAVFEVVVAHEAEDVIVYVTEEMDLQSFHASALDKTHAVFKMRGSGALHQVPLSSTNQTPASEGACKRSRYSSDTYDDN